MLILALGQLASLISDRQRLVAESPTYLQLATSEM